MPSVGHIAVGCAAARWSRREPRTRRDLTLTMLAYSALSLCPDVDVVGFALGIPYRAPLGHRGAAHSLVVAVTVGTVAAMLMPCLGLTAFRRVLLCSVVVASHGLLDTLTDGGLGSALFWPFSERRFFAPWRPIPVAPSGARFLSSGGLRVAVWELAYFLPLFLYAFWRRRWRAPGDARRT